jgi:hypothetical protein
MLRDRNEVRACPFPNSLAQVSWRRSRAAAVGVRRRANARGSHDRAFVITDEQHPDRSSEQPANGTRLEHTFVANAERERSDVVQHWRAR